MKKSLSFTVHPSALGGEYLTVSDAMRQVLDLIDALERLEGAEENKRNIVWRLTEAHTNSPPFTVTASAFPVDPVLSIGMEAERIASDFVTGMATLLGGDVPPWLDGDIATPLRRALKRNLNGIGQTDIQVDDAAAVNVLPASAQSALSAIDHLEGLQREAALVLRRTEFGAIEAAVIGITRWNDKPALTVIERLSGDKITCVLSPELADTVGPAHLWKEAWANDRVLVTGALHFGEDGALKRINADSLEPRPYTDVALSELRDIDILQGKTVSEHISRIRGEELG